jgi:acyl carrier protein
VMGHTSATSLGLDSLDLVEGVLILEEVFNICIDDAEAEQLAHGGLTVESIVSFVQSKLA